ncbi:WD repeat-containing protein 90-like [Branchiostoma floridae]|uniref:WD repeat-containing protein 90-like n=1 Tax=Branchiostoma floridae TaxID=7739 RepID=A0A9J7M569_BRAFL|nr:WD repeat-containing protein 90-like [Branchiostoma floridae]
MSKLWQHPYVNVFKHLNVAEWKKASKEGEVSTIMDKTLKSSVYRVTGSVPAGNYIQLPKTASQSLGLTGRFLYILFKPIPGKYFVVHLDVATQDGLVIRISFSNLFREFKSTATWLQFPYVCHAARGSVQELASIGNHDNLGPAPAAMRWTVLMLDLHYILSVYLNQRYAYLKSVRLCANLFVKNMFTSDMEYEPGLSLSEAKKTGVLAHGVTPMPREMAFPVPKGETWHDRYDFVRFPSATKKPPFDSIQRGDKTTQVSQFAEPGTISPKRTEPKEVQTSRPIRNPVSTINHITSPKRGPHKRRPITASLPPVGVATATSSESSIAVQPVGDEVHVYAHPTDEVIVHRHNEETGKVSSVRASVPSTAGPIRSSVPKQSAPRPTAPVTKKSRHRTLKPDPILKLKRIVGFGGSTTRDALWTANGQEIVYPCHAVIVAMETDNGHQRFLIGHTDKVSALSFDGYSRLLASAQTGSTAVVRVWRFHNGECLSVFKTHVHSAHSLSFSQDGDVLCGVGKDGHGKNMVVVWDTSRVTRGGNVDVLAKAHTDVDIIQLRLAPHDPTRMVSCGRDNIRFWRLKHGSLRSAPVSLGEYHSMEFTDIMFPVTADRESHASERKLVYASTRSGYIFEVNAADISIHHVRRLLPVDPGPHREKPTFHSVAGGIAVNAIYVNESFCVTGSDDGYLRLWPLDFTSVFLEAEHEGPVTAVRASHDGLKVLAGTTTGNLGILDIPTRSYTTVMRSHTDRISDMSLDLTRAHIATVSADHTIRVWDMTNFKQLYDFSAPKECPCAVAYHPSQQVLACGFENGCVRVFNVSSTSLIAEHKQHRGKVVGLTFSPSGSYLYSADYFGTLVMYSTTEPDYAIIRVLGNMVARSEAHAPHALAMSEDSRHLAFVGPSDFTVSVVDARSLDEVLRVDITSMEPDVARSVVDRAVRVHFSPAAARQLLVATSSNRLLRLDARTGRLLNEVSNIHRSSCSALAVSQDCRHLVTAGDKVVKVWDYHTRLDINFQVFIGHSEAISGVGFTPDGAGLVTVGDAMFLWDVMANVKKPEEPGGRTPKKAWHEADPGTVEPIHDVRDQLLLDTSYQPRPAPIPTRYSPPNISSILPTMNGEMHTDELRSDTESEMGGTEVLIGPDLTDRTDEETDTATDAEFPQPESLGHSHRVQPHQRVVSPGKKAAGKVLDPRLEHSTTGHDQPLVKKHFVPREKSSNLAQRRYTAPPNQAGLTLQAVIGYNGNGRGNMVWNSDTGVFAYTSGCVVILEDLNSGEQKHLTGHVEEVSTLALQNDCQVLVSASGSRGLVKSQVCVWDLQKNTCRQVLHYHQHDIVCLAYSRDDRFLVTVGDYRECTIALWSTFDYSLLTATKTSLPIHDLGWDPFNANEFTSIGQAGSIFFWLVDETNNKTVLNVHEADVPKEILQPLSVVPTPVDFTALCYSADNILYVGGSNGVVSAWDTRQNMCFMHWTADSGEIGVLVCKAARLVTGSTSQRLKLWAVVGVGDMRIPTQFNTTETKGLTMDDEMVLDGQVTCAAFDDTMDLGIVGTTGGTLWYINWVERTNIRLVSGHGSKINSLGFSNDDYFATCGEDGSLHVWSVQDREQTLQFQVVDQSCTCVAFSSRAHPPPTRVGSDDVSSTYMVAGYSDGTVRMFELDSVEMVLKMHPHAVAITAVTFAADGRAILSGASDGLIAVSSPTTGMTLRILNDHKGAPITAMDTIFKQDKDYGVTAPILWLATSADRRVSVWAADWTRDLCELVDWMSFPAPAFDPDGNVVRKTDLAYYASLPPSLAQFVPDDPDTVVYTGYGMQRQVQYYSLTHRKVLRTSALTNWVQTMDISPKGNLLAFGDNERLVKLMDFQEGSFQDFVAHCDAVHLVRFTPSGKLLFTVAHNEIMVWEVSL